MWMVLILRKGHHEVHSVHRTEEIARQWAACKLHDGEDSSLAYADSDVVEAIGVEIEATRFKGDGR